MNRDDYEQQDKIKYSIWETRTEDSEFNSPELLKEQAEKMNNKDNERQ